MVDSSLCVQPANASRSNNMTSIYQLPTEVLDNILLYLDNGHPSFPSFEGRKGKGDFRNLCLASKQLLPQIQTYLCSSFWITDSSRTWTIREFLRTLLCRPSLAVNVKKVGLCAWCAWDRASDAWDQPSYDTNRQSLTPCDQKLFQRAATSLALPERDHWYRLIRKNNDEVYIALLLLVLPNLRELTILAPSNSPILAKALHHVATLQPVAEMGLQRLEKVYFGVRGEDKTHGDLVDVVPFLRIPSIRRIEISGWASSTASSSQIASVQSDLTHLSILCGGVEPNAIGQILKSAPHVESFHYIHGHINELHFHPRAFGDALRMTKHSLKVLKIWTDAQNVYNSVTASPYSHNLGTLRDFSRLKELYVSFEVLLGPSLPTNLVDVLPPSIVHIKVEDFDGTWSKLYCEELVYCLVELFEHKEDRTPQLYEVAANYLPNRPDRNKRSKRAIVKLIKAAMDAAIVLKDSEWGKICPQDPRLWLYKEGWI